MNIAFLLKCQVSYLLIVSVPDTVKVATPQLTVLVPGATVIKGACGAGAFTITIPEPPDPPD
jgi:hypothetical protein